MDFTWYVQYMVPHVTLLDMLSLLPSLPGQKDHISLGRDWTFVFTK